MIKSKDLNLEIKILEDKVKEDKVSDADIVKALCLIAKVLRDVRTNQVLGLRKAGVTLITPRTSERTEGKKSEKAE